MSNREKSENMVFNREIRKSITDRKDLKIMLWIVWFPGR